MPKMPEMPKMPDAPSAPQMPTFSSSGNGFNYYKPSVPNQNTSAKSEKSDSKTTGSAKNETILSDGTTSTEQYAKIFNKNSTLTASDISSLYDSGLFSGISSLGNLNTNNSLYATSTNTNILLQQVLNSLDELKKQQKNASAEEFSASSG